MFLWSHYDWYNGHIWLSPVYTIQYTHGYIMMLVLLSYHYVGYHLYSYFVVNVFKLSSHSVNIILGFINKLVFLIFCFFS